jgi:hypothetical protein
MLRRSNSRFKRTSWTGSRQPAPVEALSELIWNSLDADARNVTVEFDSDAFGLL